MNSAGLPERIVLTGFMGAGKSTVGPRLAAELGWAFVDLDEEIVRADGRSIAAIFETAGESRFRELEHLALAEALKRSRTVVALGGGAVETAANRGLLLADRETVVLYLEAPLEVLVARCGEQQQAVPGSARRPVLERQSELADRFARRRTYYETAHWTIETAGRNPDEIVRDVLIRISELGHAAHSCEGPELRPG